MTNPTRIYTEKNAEELMNLTAQMHEEALKPLTVHSAKKLRKLTHDVFALLSGALDIDSDPNVDTERVALFSMRWDIINACPVPGSVTALANELYRGGHSFDRIHAKLKSLGNYSVGG